MIYMSPSLPSMLLSGGILILFIYPVQTLCKFNSLTQAHYFRFTYRMQINNTLDVAMSTFKRFPFKFIDRTQLGASCLVCLF